MVSSSHSDVEDRPANANALFSGQNMLREMARNEMLKQLGGNEYAKPTRFRKVANMIRLGAVMNRGSNQRVEAKAGSNSKRRRSEAASGQAHSGREGLGQGQGHSWRQRPDRRVSDAGNSHPPSVRATLLSVFRPGADPLDQSTSMRVPSLSIGHRKSSSKSLKAPSLPSMPFLDEQDEVRLPSDPSPVAATHSVVSKQRSGGTGAGTGVGTGAGAGVGGGAGRPRRRILVVDDSSMNRKMLGKVLRSTGDVLEEACDGQDAVEKVAAALRETMRDTDSAGGRRGGLGGASTTAS